MMDDSQRRYGDMFTLKIANEGTWVFLSHPDAVKQVFKGDPRLLHAGEAMGRRAMSGSAMPAPAADRASALGPCRCLVLLRTGRRRSARILGGRDAQIKSGTAPPPH